MQKVEPFTGLDWFEWVHPAGDQMNQHGYSEHSQGQIAVKTLTSETDAVFTSTKKEKWVELNITLVLSSRDFTKRAKNWIEATFSVLDYVTSGNQKQLWPTKDSLQSENILAGPQNFYLLPEGQDLVLSLTL